MGLGEFVNGCTQFEFFLFSFCVADLLGDFLEVFFFVDEEGAVGFVLMFDFFEVFLELGFFPV